MEHTILVTGSTGMIGSRTVQALTEVGYHVIGLDLRPSAFAQARYTHLQIDLADRQALEDLFAREKIDRVIHLAALAHTDHEDDLSWQRYCHINVECAENIFRAAADRPILFISTVDVYGFTGGVVTPETEPKPVTFYGRSKRMAEQVCCRMPCYTIFRFSPVYTEELRRDIQKRYYLKAPHVAYRIGTGRRYEILHLDRAVQAMVDWCGEVPQNQIRIIKDPQAMDTAEYIKAEKAVGRATVVLRFPDWMVRAGYAVAKKLTGENKYTYLLNKAVHPLHSEENDL